MGNSMSNVGAQGPDSGALSGESGREALGGGADIEFSTDTTGTPGGSGASGAFGDMLGFIEDVIGTGYGDSLAEAGAVEPAAAFGTRMFMGGGSSTTLGGEEGDTGYFVVNEVMDINASDDQLKLSDLLHDEDSEGGSLSSFLRFTFDAETNSTIVSVSAAGHVSTEVDQQIVLAGVGDLTAHGSNSDLSIIASLLSGQLNTDV